MQNRRADPRKVVSIILGGGAGTRLFPLTKRRAKPAVRICILLLCFEAPPSLPNLCCVFVSIDHFWCQWISRVLANSFWNACGCMFWSLASTLMHIHVANLLLFQLGGIKGGVFVRYFIWRKQINHDTHACMTCVRRCQSVGHIGWLMCQWAIVSTVVLTKCSFLPNSTRLRSIVTLLVHTALEMASSYVMVLLRYGHFAFWNGKHKKKGHWHRVPLRFSTLILNFWSSSRVIDLMFETDKSFIIQTVSEVCLLSVNSGFSGIGVFHRCWQPPRHLEKVVMSGSRELQTQWGNTCGCLRCKPCSLHLRCVSIV
jgi:hypothetical protein